MCLQNKETPLHLAAIFGHWQSLKQLLLSGALVDHLYKVGLQASFFLFFLNFLPAKGKKENLLTVSFLLLFLFGLVFSISPGKKETKHVLTRVFLLPPRQNKKMNDSLECLKFSVGIYVFSKQ